MTFPMLVADSETTGVDTETARIVSFYLGVLEADGAISREQEWIIAPAGYEIPAEASAIHGISTEEAARRGASAEDVLGQIVSVIQAECQDGRRLPLAGANLSYDLTLLDREIRRHLPWVEERGVTVAIDGVNILDSYVIDKAVDQFRRGSRKLIDTAAHYGVHLSEEEAHGAKADAVAAGRVIQAIAALRDQILAGQTLQQVHQHQIRWRATQATGLQKWLREKAPADRRDPNAVVDGSWPYQPLEQAKVVAA